MYVYIYIYMCVYVYVYTHTYLIAYRLYELPLLPNNTAVKHVYTNQSSPIKGLEWPRGFQEIKVPRFHENGTGWW
jgi:hypothetical protein